MEDEKQKLKQDKENRMSYKMDFYDQLDSMLSKEDELVKGVVPLSPVLKSDDL